MIALRISAICIACLSISSTSSPVPAIGKGEERSPLAKDSSLVPSSLRGVAMFLAVNLPNFMEMNIAVAMTPRIRTAKIQLVITKIWDNLLPSFTLTSRSSFSLS